MKLSKLFFISPPLSLIFNEGGLNAAKKNKMIRVSLPVILTQAQVDHRRI